MAAKHTLKFGAAGFAACNLLIERAGALEVARDLDWRADGAPCLNVRNHACMFPSRASQRHFLYSP